MYLDTMQQVYSNVSKGDGRQPQGSNLLYLPLDKLMQQTGAGRRRPGPTARRRHDAWATTPVLAHRLPDHARKRDGSRRDRDGR